MPVTPQAGLRYAVDIVFCIDVTGSMAPVLEQVKTGALSLHERLQAMMAERSKLISQLRIRVVAFRDFADRADDALETTDFLLIPEQADRFGEFVRGLKPTGGGDEPESGLEALAVAIGSDWERGLDRRRHVIVVFTDASAHPLGTDGARRAATYPAGIPQTMDDLFEAWGHRHSQTATMENSAKRLLLFAPDTTPWNMVAADWNNTIFTQSRAGDGLEEFEMDEILHAIANSV